MSLKFEHVSYAYKNSNMASGIEDISFSLDNHFFTGIIGHTGSGKSTLIQHINALIRPDKGIIKAQEFTIDSNNKKKLKFIKELRKNIGVVFQFSEYQLFEETVLKDVSFGPRNFGLSQDEAINRAKVALKEVGIDESYYDKSPFELSGGEKRKVAIAGIIASNPKILVLDEPCAGLDPKSSKDMMDLFFDLYNKGTSIVMVSHDMDIILKYCTNCLVLQHGKLIGDYKPTDLFYDSKTLEEVGINPPLLINYVNIAIKKEYKIDKEKVKDIPSFIKELLEVKK